MKRLLFCICLVLSVQIMSAQIITSKSTVVQKVEKTPTLLEKGYRGFVDVAAGGIGYFPTCFQFAISTTHGYQFNHWLYLGVGVELLGLQTRIKYKDAYDEHWNHDLNFSLPIYANARFYLTQTHIKPFIDARIGYAIPLHWSTGLLSRRGHADDLSRTNGLYGSLGVGIEYKCFDFAANWTPIQADSKGLEREANKDIVVASFTFSATYNF